jgi:phosphohistidine phosphatase SixA
MLRRLFWLLLILLAVPACASLATADEGAETIWYVLVRHAEKAGDDPRDPGLSEAGQQRAQALARLLTDSPLRAVYATPYRRTRLTAEPAAQAHGLAVTVREFADPDPVADASLFASELRGRHQAGTVLIVGHSNTVPALASALGGGTVPAIADDEFDRLILIAVSADGTARLFVLRY